MDIRLLPDDCQIGIGIQGEQAFPQDIVEGFFLVKQHHPVLVEIAEIIG